MVVALGGKCVKCGSTKNLQIDHKDPKVKIFDISECWAFSPERLAEELKKCQVLCKECHEAKSVAEGSVAGPTQHGSRRMYQRGCRCESCRTFAAEYRNARRARRKAAGLPRT